MSEQTCFFCRRSLRISPATSFQRHVIDPRPGHGYPRICRNVSEPCHVNCLSHAYKSARMSLEDVQDKLKRIEPGLRALLKLHPDGYPYEDDDPRSVLFWLAKNYGEADYFFCCEDCGWLPRERYGGSDADGVELCVECMDGLREESESMLRKAPHCVGSWSGSDEAMDQGQAMPGCTNCGWWPCWPLDECCPELPVQAAVADGFPVFRNGENCRSGKACPDAKECVRGLHEGCPDGHRWGPFGKGDTLAEPDGGEG